MALQYHIIPVTAFVQNCTVLWCSATRLAAIVDPGGELSLIESFVEQNQLVIDKVWITHGHVDHAGSAEDLAKKYGVPIEGPHEGDAFWLNQLGEQARLFNFPHKVPERLSYAVHWLMHQDKVTVGKESLDVLHCPGHTPGHVVFYSKTAQLVVVGDVLFKRSVGRSDLPGGNAEQLLTSIRHHLFTLPDNTQVIPGHGHMTTIGDEKRHNPFFQS